MARKQLKYTVSDAGRDQGKVFLITEMSARRGHQWATRVLFGIMNAGLEIPDNVLNAGFAGIAAIGVKALGKLPVSVAEPLLDELMTCVQIIPNPANPDIVRNLVDDDTEEILTIFKLQKEVLALHVDFSTTVANLTSASATEAAEPA
jgi:hypothetical protein